MEERYKEIWECGNTLEDNYLLIIENLQQELSKANDKLKKIDTFIREHQLFGMRFAKTLYQECLEHILSIIKGEEK